MALPISLLVDDGSPINMMFWHHPWEAHEILIPNSVVRDFAKLCKTFGVKGKFSVIPMPAAKGRIDRSLNGVSASHLRTFLSLVRERIAPSFDITCELLTHPVEYHTHTGYFGHRYEDAWVAQASIDEMTDYISVALEILDNVGLRPTGVTSPWGTGSTNETAYAEAITRAFHRTLRRKNSWYFRMMMVEGEGLWPYIAWEDKRKGIRTVSVPVNTNDEFWDVQAGTVREVRAAARAGADALLTADGKSGRIRELYDQQAPITICTHWQCMFANGRDVGLRALETVLERIDKHFAGDVEWMRCSDLAKLHRPKPAYIVQT